LHIDSWVEILIIDGYKITLKKEKYQGLNKLYFINLGAYDSNKFEELHESKFMVGMEINTIKNRAIKSLLIDMHQVHTDDLYDVDNCIEIIKVSNLYVHLEKLTK
jgi:hypothetical protein|tara:strand:- start:208 stop:522 length:315 start_codon:yes stop_codon:yes gene_type:complete